MLIALVWQAAIAFAVVWLGVAFLTRYSSLAALVAAVAVPIVLFVMGYVDYAVVLAVMSAIVFYKHRANIRRLMDGSESRIGAKG